MPLRFNRLSKEVESQGKEVDADTMWAEGCKPLERYTSVDVFYRVLVKKAKEDSYHPVQEYLEGCYQKYGDDVGILNNMAKRLRDDKEAKE